MSTEAQRRANAKYVREKTKTFSLRLFPADADVIAWLDKQPKKAAYIKRLIREDMSKH